MRKKLLHLLKYSFLGLFLFFLIIQLVPYGRNHSNPPVEGEPKWDRPQTKALFDRTCADCHSHQTKWPWYSHLAPVSWLVQKDVEEGRSKFNTSRWGTMGKNEGDEAAESLQEGEMPPSIYLITHPEARLNLAEKTALVEGLIATFGQEKDKHAETGENTRQGKDSDGDDD